MDFGQRQVVQSYGGTVVAQWRRRWGTDDVSDHWLGAGFIYHEANAVLVSGQELKLWDGSSGCWLNPAQTKDYGSVLAIQIWGSDGEGLAFRWAITRSLHVAGKKLASRAPG